MLIARALLLDIRLLVADEIISMLDASTRIDVLNLLGDLKSRGLGILFITHDLSLGNYICDRDVIMRRGAVVEMGATERVFGNPLHPYTKTLLASVPQLHTKWADIEPRRPPPVDGRRRHARRGRGRPLRRVGEVRHDERRRDAPTRRRARPASRGRSGPPGRATSSGARAATRSSRAT